MQNLREADLRELPKSRDGQEGVGRKRDLWEKDNSKDGQNLKVSKDHGKLSSDPAPALTSC